MFSCNFLIKIFETNRFRLLEACDDIFFDENLMGDFIHCQVLALQSFSAHPNAHIDSKQKRSTNDDYVTGFVTVCLQMLVTFLELFFKGNACLRTFGTMRIFPVSFTAPKIKCVRFA